MATPAAVLRWVRVMPLQAVRETAKAANTAVFKNKDFIVKLLVFMGMRNTIC